MKKLLFIGFVALVVGSVCWAPPAGCAQPPSGASDSRQEQLAAAIEKLPENARVLLRDIVLRPEFKGVLSKEQAQELAKRLGCDLKQTALTLISLAKIYALPPISNFHVGAVAIGRSGSLYFGCNLEFPGQALSFVVHGEQSATMNAWTHGETELEALAITASPCGYCRQFLNELNSAGQLEILLENSPATRLSALLPQSFGPVDLGIKAKLMEKDAQPLQLPDADKDKVIAAALAAAASSYAPYSLNHAGLALESQDGVLVSGRYAENAAYSPSMSPLEAALVLYNFANQDFARIKRAVLVQTKAETANQEGATRAVLSSLPGSPKLEIYWAKPK